MGKEFKPEKLPLRNMLEAKSAPIPLEKRTELAIAATKMERPPRVTKTAHYKGFSAVTEANTFHSMLYKAYIEKNVYG